MAIKKDDQLTDQQAIERIIAGNIDSYAVIMRRYEASLTRYAVYLARDEAVAADVVQEAFIKAYQNLRSYDPSYKFSSWIYRITHNEAINAIRQEKYIDRSVEMSGVELSYDFKVADSIDLGILKQDLAMCLAQLDQKYRDVVVLHYLEGMKYEDIADVLAVPTSTVGVWLSRAKAKLKAICRKKGVN